MFAPLLCVLLLAAGPERPPDEVLAEAAGESITRGRVNLLLKLRGTPASARAAAWDDAVQTLADRARMRRFLASRRATPDAKELETQTAALLARFGKDEEAQTVALQKLGVTADDVRAEAALPLAWEQQARRLITPDALRDHFEANRLRYDDTALTVAHIFQPGDATAELAKVKQQIDAGALTFAQAAAQHSQAPTAKSGGVIGPLRPGDGKAPPEVTAAAFDLAQGGATPGAVSEPVRSAVGTHLVTVLGVAEPGELTLEDVLAPVRRDLSRQLWFEQLERLR
ncbi:peptidylprolyl isomerase [Alienimonas californiensis]|uniref:Foldase protein PrsA 1 n=1 Tax=Alienimonas californiensis TaxID=2527989 RepID=A0A517P7P1_9PLAN|nr:peptidylprolyl isomerase [Alienimonas californiensis]QDT15388.1 Foldase protein PrsA 1 precursor [Alienimonas californiensis]